MPVPMVIALIFGVIAIAILGYWFTSQSSKLIGTGGVTECGAKQQSFCQQWLILSRFGVKPPGSFSSDCNEPIPAECSIILSCSCASSANACPLGTRAIGSGSSLCSGLTPMFCCP